ncbi:1,4-dihydroxy-2-naphthoate octaprenyltransferase [Croceimicrobium sp.]|uniref:1,4-dihydroxy-2-naphthoate octaprenyltransferase n=1 Tax=Croceimicrobium sp. TaxID=2828340 RepID=UPI003BAD1CAA
MSGYKVWIAAARLRTLPLAFASIILGSLLAYSQGSFDIWVFLLSILTTLCYQVLSNYANDYGDGIKGTDADRIGEARATASGLISVTAMRKAVVIFSLLSIAFGTALSFYACRDLGLAYQLAFTLLGLLSTWAAISYTVGDRAYGYSGFGDVFVLLFFGIVGVGGSYYLQTGTWNYSILLPAGSLGFLAMAVLNLNNMRDREGDAKSGKNTLALKLGERGAKAYHFLLVIGAFDLAFLYNRIHPTSNWQNLYFLTLPLLFLNLKKVLKASRPLDYEPLLKQMALSTLFFALLFGLGKAI